MIERCIMIFPEFNNENIIDDLRTKYDPLVKHVRPHITVVFPFESDISTRVLKKHIESALRDISVFDLILEGIVPSKSGGNYLFLQVVKGGNKIKEIHDRLYTYILADYLRKDLSYVPHMTVGNLCDERTFLQAIEETKKITAKFETKVNKISVEIIDKNQDSIIEIEHKLYS